MGYSNEFDNVNRQFALWTKLKNLVTKYFEIRKIQPCEVFEFLFKFVLCAGKVPANFGSTVVRFPAQICKFRKAIFRVFYNIFTFLRCSYNLSAPFPGSCSCSG